MAADRPRILSLAINEDDNSASLDRAMSVADHFELEKDQAKAIAAQVGKAVSTWRTQRATWHGKRRKRSHGVCLWAQ